MTKTKLLIFDLDNTLVDTYKSNFLAYQRSFGLENIDLDEDLYKKLYGYSFVDLIANMGLNLTKNQIHNIKNNKSIFYQDTIKFARLNQHLIDIINCCKDNSYIALASTASKNNVYMVLDYFNIRDKFDIVLTAESVKYNKPDPEIFLKAIEYFNIPVSNVVIYEDSDKGLSGALQTGASVYKVCNF